MERIDPLIRLLRNCDWEDGCLVWQGSGPREYGTFQPGTRALDPKEYVHRFAYLRFVGLIPSGKEIDHVAARGCHSKRCILPWHLEAVTHRENRNRARLKVCRAGKHDLTDPANVRWDGNGCRRGCLICHRERALARYHERV